MIAVACPASLGQESPKAQEGKGIPVKAVRVGKAEKKLITGLGSIKCPKSVDLGFEVPGTISEILVREGQGVRQGEVVALLDQTTVDAEVAVHRARLKSAEAELRFKRAELEKMQELFDKKAISDSELKKAVFEAEKAEASIETVTRERESAEAKKRQMTLRSPTDGIVAKILLKVGEVVTYSSYQVLRLISCGEADAEIEMAEKAYTSVRLDQPVAVAVDALPGRKFQGTVYSISPEINQTNRTFTVKVRVHNPESILRSGMFARADIDVSRKGGLIWIPDKALLSSTGDHGAVFVVKDGVALRKEIRIGSREEARVQVVAGLEHGDIVVVEGQDRISDLTEVTVTIQSEDG